MDTDLPAAKLMADVLFLLEGRYTQEQGPSEAYVNTLRRECPKLVLRLEIVELLVYEM